VPRLIIQPLTLERWPDLEAIFNAKGCSIARGCWCMYYRQPGAQWNEQPESSTRTEARRSALLKLVGQGPPPGLIAYHSGTPVGWVTLGPRSDFVRLAKSPVMKPVDDKPVWSIVCFVVPSQYRGQGVAHALLKGAITFARQNGAKLVEGYPIDKPGRSVDGFIWHGVKSMFDTAGFGEVARRKPQRPVMRLKLANG
jgi:GNAT superfamily N-acetyltransferase